MSYPAHGTAESRRPPANVIRLPRRAGANPARPAAEPLALPAHIPDLLQRAREDLSSAEAVLQRGSGAPRYADGVGGPGRAVPDDHARPGSAGCVLDARDHVPVEFRLLGCFRVARAGHDIASSSFGGRRTRQLLQVLLRDRGRVVPKDVLIEALWADRDPADPEANLAVLVSRARHALGEGSLILSRPGGYLYADDDRTWVDAEAFARRAEQGGMSLAAGNAAVALQAYRSALALWVGDPFMENMYAEWAQDFRRHFSLLYEQVLAGLAKASLEFGQAATAVHAARQLTQRAPLREEAHVLLMKALAAAGDPAGAISAFHEWRHRLADELGVDPSQEASGVFQRILRQESPGYALPLPLDMSAPGSRFGTCAGLAADVLGWIPDAAYVLGHDDRILYVNPRAAEIAGLPATCLRGMPARAAFPDDWLEAYRNCADTALAAGESGCFRAFCAHLGSWLEWAVYPGEQGILILSRNLTWAVRAEESVRRALAAVEASRSELLAHAGWQ